MKSLLTILAIAFMTVATTVSAARAPRPPSTIQPPTPVTPIVVPVVVPTSSTGGGGASYAFNYTTNRMEIIPQCFPEIFMPDFYLNNLTMLYVNQQFCRDLRKAYFGW